MTICLKLKNKSPLTANTELQPQTHVQHCCSSDKNICSWPALPFLVWTSTVFNSFLFPSQRNSNQLHTVQKEFWPISPCPKGILTSLTSYEHVLTNPTTTNEILTNFALSKRNSVQSHASWRNSDQTQHFRANFDQSHSSWRNSEQYHPLSKILWPI